MNNINPIFLLWVAFWSAVGWLVNDSTGAVTGAACAMGISLLLSILSK